MMKKKLTVHKNMYDPTSIEARIKELTTHIQETNSELTKITEKIDEKGKELQRKIDKLSRKLRNEKK